jgi:hypothetical protein
LPPLFFRVHRRLYDNLGVPVPRCTRIKIPTLTAQKARH